MDLLETPFNVLGASVRDGRQRLRDLAEERSVLGDPDACARARADLTHPRKRLSAEVAWLPGVAPARARAAIAGLADGIGSVRFPMARANLLAASLRLCRAEDMASSILDLAVAFDRITPAELRAAINEDRAIAGFPEVDDSAVAEALNARGQYFRQVFRGVLDRLPSAQLVHVLNMLVTKAGARAPILVDHLVDTFEVEAHRFLEAEAANINSLLGAIRKAAYAPDREAMDKLYSRLEAVVGNWCTVARPIQSSLEGRGRDHDLTGRVAGSIRQSAVALFNERNDLLGAVRLTSILEKFLAVDPRLRDKIEEDRKTLRNLEEVRQKADLERKEWEKAVSYEVILGAIFAEPLRISAAGVEWQSKLWPLEAITRISWGATRKMGGIEYAMAFGTASQIATIVTTNSSIFTGFSGHLWLAVGPRLVGDLVRRVANGEHIAIGTALVRNDGVELPRLVPQWERTFVPWAEISISTGNGALHIMKKSDSLVAASLEYRWIDNVHVFEAALRALFKSSSRLLSDLLRG